ncbi:ABC transporter, ATP-binding protein (cluster 5, nickel/peptides/opines) / ABC transporter, ATP-binding protein (cluster 5, nickel/peptides/opines) [hydrothermal vent metagenome]|uniref:ABC transporter, ATP-binding protein (Cluster 5, nickel/peptides/opines) / ABC transporter, ATP-binding protein (Cluster 5, nickel/peptides/opines) n=1 Tax=hydrothermal vent metagenome TaxID=652676 RepID=A0A3B0ZL82_9ZZZZ
MSEVLLKVDQLHTHLATGKKVVRAVEGVSFEINKGETFCLVGESGSGKSITALSIMKLLPGSIASHPSGSIKLVGTHPINILDVEEDNMRDIRGSRIAMIFQEPMNSLNPVYTIGEQIIEALQIHQPDLSDEQARTKAIKALDDVQIPDPAQRIDEYPHRLSGGQRQRVMIAMALACEPELLIADEPTTALDVTVQAEILKLMKDLQQRNNMSILFITHDFGVVAQMAHKLAVMQLGKIVEQGDVQTVLKNPQHDYTKQLLAALPENLKQQHRARILSEIKQFQTEQSDHDLIKIENLKVYFPIKKGVFRHTVDHVRAVDDVSLNIKQGEILALVGESGCGKTTLGRALLRLEETTDGAFYYNNHKLSQLTQKQIKPYRQDLQFIFQDPMSSLNPRLNIATTLIEPMTVHKIGNNKSERIHLAEQALEQVQLNKDYLWRYPHEFSGGQRQRIGIARSLVLNPKFIVCDEVTSALDVSVQAEILDILLKLRKDYGLTLLFITHNISVVEYISDRIAVMYKGKIVEQGETDQVTGSPQHDYTKQLLAAVPRLAY